MIMSCAGYLATMDHKFDVSCHEKSSPRADLLLRNFVYMRVVDPARGFLLRCDLFILASLITFIHAFGFGRCHKYRMEKLNKQIGAKMPSFL